MYSTHGSIVERIGNGVLGDVRRAGLGLARLGGAGHGWARQGAAGCSVERIDNGVFGDVPMARRGWARRGWARQGKGLLVAASSASATVCSAMYPRRGTAELGSARRGMAWLGEARQGAAGCSRQGSPCLVRLAQPTGRYPAINRIGQSAPERAARATA